MSIQVSLVLLFFSVLIVSTTGRTLLEENDSVSTTDHHKQKGTKWALLIAGSSGFDNYRHQADVCHAYQILKKNGLKDVLKMRTSSSSCMMASPTIRKTLERVSLSTSQRARTSTMEFQRITQEMQLTLVIFTLRFSETNLQSKEEAARFLRLVQMIIFSYTTLITVLQDFLGCLICVLKKKHASKGFKSMVFYLEACESGSMFDGLLPKNINIYATTAANGEESSYATYCDGDIPRKIGTCLGDLYSISWLEDCDVHDLRKETFEVQYERVKNRTDESHVMQYGDMSYVKEFLDKYMGASSKSHHSHATHAAFTPSTSVSQRDASLVRFLHKVNNALPGSQEQLEAQKQLDDEVARRKRVDESITKIGKLLFGDESSSGNSMMKVRPSGQPLVDDWECFKAFIKTYENRCGKLSTYGMKYTRAFANMCNDGIGLEKLDAASDLACSN